MREKILSGILALLFFTVVLTGAFSYAGEREEDKEMAKFGNFQKFDKPDKAEFVDDGVFFADEFFFDDDFFFPRFPFFAPRFFGDD